MSPSIRLSALVASALAVSLAASDTIDFYAPPTYVDETAGGVDVMVIRTGTGGGAAAIDVTVTGGYSGAVEGVDFQAPSPGSLAWTDGDRSYRVVHIPVLHQPAYTPAHSLEVKLVNPVGANVGLADPVIHIPIIEHETNPAGYLSVLLPDTTGTLNLLDNCGSLWIRVSRNNGSQGAVSTTLSFVDLTAKAGSDYLVPQHPTLDWADGESGVKSVEVPLIARHSLDGPRSFSFNIYDISGGAGLGLTGIGVNGNSGANVIITDHLPQNAGTIAVPALVSVNETAGTATVHVSRSGGTTGAVSVDWATMAGSAQPGINYTDSHGTLHWGNGDGADKTITIPVLRDHVATPTLYAGITFTHGNGGLIVPPYTSTGLAINDVDNVAGTIAVIDTLVSVREDAGTATVQVARQGGTTGAVDVGWTTSFGMASQTAVDGVNYTGGSGTLHWDDGDGGNKTISIPILYDSALGPDAYFRIDLLDPPSGGALLYIDPDMGWAESIVTIVDVDDHAGSIAWVDTDVSVSENAGSVTLTARRSGGSTGPVSVPLGILDLTARMGIDYLPGDTYVLSWADGDTADKTVTLPIIASVTPDDDRSFRVILGPPSGGAAFVMPNTAIVTIQESDAVHMMSRTASGPGARSAAGDAAVAASAGSAPGGGGGGGCSGGAVAILLCLAGAGLRQRRR